MRSMKITRLENWYKSKILNVESSDTTVNVSADLRNVAGSPINVWPQNVVCITVKYNRPTKTRM